MKRDAGSSASASPRARASSTGSEPAAEGVYFDHNATSPPDPRVVEAMLPWLGARHGNPSSVHAAGRAARAALEEARAEVAASLGASPPEVVFTGSGTEANSTVLSTVLSAVLNRAVSKRAVLAGPSSHDVRRHVVISALEHPSIVEGARALEHAGFDVERILPDPSGRVDAARLAEVVRADTALVCLMLANNELGTLQPVAEVARLCRERGTPVLCDAVQAMGKIRVDVEELAVDYLTIGGHKFHGPIGAAALWVREGAPFEPLLRGGGQERRRRAGTENVPAIVGLGRACRLATEELEARRRHLADLRDRFEAGLGSIEGVRLHGTDVPRLPHTSHVAFDGVAGESLVQRLDLAGYAVSTGAACASGVTEPSSTLMAMGLDRDEALGSIRVSFGMPNRADEVDAFLPVLEREVGALRAFRRRSAASGASG